MKIRIDFSKEEKNMIMETMECKKDTREYVKGRFGDYEYNNEYNYLEFNFNFEFIKSLCGVIASIASLVKSFITLMEEFSKEWFSDLDQINRYDENGNLVYAKTEEGNYWYKYNEDNNMIHRHVKSEDYEAWYEYDGKGNEIRRKTNEYELKYDKKGNVTYCKTSDGNEWIREYNKDGKEIHFKNLVTGYEEWTEYDEEGNKVRTIYDDYTIEYDKEGRKVRYFDNNGREYRYDYDEKGNIFEILIHE